MTRYYDKDIECMPRGELKKLQSERLVSQVKFVWDNVPCYRKKMIDAGVKPEDIRSIDDLNLLPFTTKADLRDTYPDGFRAVPLKDCVRVHSTSGTTGRRVIVYYTKDDIDMWQGCVARAFTAAGVTESDIVQIAYGYGLFTGGLGVDGGSCKLGCLTIPMSSGSTERQIQFIHDLGVSVICATPSYAAYLAEELKKREDAVTNLRVGIFGAEAWSEEMRCEIERKLGIKAYDIYGLTELSGPGVAYECSQQDGMHVNEDNFAVEIIDPKTLQPLDHGEKGELVFTALTKKGFPLIRYRTRDLSCLIDEPCQCGRTFVKMKRPMGRTDDMLIIRGVNVFPSQIETVLAANGYSVNYLIVVDRVNNSDTFDVMVEMSSDNFSDSLAKITAMEKKLDSAIREMVGIHAKVHLVSPGSIEKTDGKAVRVIDRRKF